MAFVLTFLAIPFFASTAAAEDPPPFLLKWGSLGTGDGQFNNPHGLTVDSNGNVYVADSGNHRIQKFSSTGTFLTKWGSLTTYPMQFGTFNIPADVAVDFNGYVYVADYLNNLIQKFNSSGDYWGRWWGPPGRNFYHPFAVAVDLNGNVYVADSGGTGVGFITKFNSSGTYLTENENIHSWGVAVDSSGNVYATDLDNHRIQKFNSSLTYLTEWGSRGTGDGQFESPIGVAVDSDGNVYVADSGNHRIQKFSSTGTFLTKWGAFGTGDGQFNSPRDVAVNSSGDVYVTEHYNHRIQKFGSKFEIYPNPYDFGNQTVFICSSITQEFILLNTRNENINVSNITLSNEFDYDLILNYGSNPCIVSNPVILPGENCTIGTAFCPENTGPLNANLSITSDDPVTPNIYVELKGIGQHKFIKPMDEWIPGPYYFGFYPWLGNYCTSKVGKGKNSTINNYPMVHTGVDVNVGRIKNGKNLTIKPVKSAAKGIIKGVCYDPKWAYALVIEHDADSNESTTNDKFTTVYWHIDIKEELGITLPNKKMCTTVNPWVQIEQGKEIGSIADLGNNSHLHFGIRIAPFDVNLSPKGALPSSLSVEGNSAESCGGNPAFPEYFADPNEYFAN